MNSKMLAYAIFAVVLGYLITSTVPANIIPKEEEFMLTEKEAPLMGAEADSSMRPAEESIPPEETMPLEEPMLPETSVWNDAFNYGLLIFDLFIALGIYFIVKRRFP